MRARTLLVGATLATLVACQETPTVEPESRPPAPLFSHSDSDVCPGPFGCFAITPATEQELEQFALPVLLDDPWTLTLTSSSMGHGPGFFSTCGLLREFYSAVLVKSGNRNGPVRVAMKQIPRWEEVVPPQPGTRFKIDAVWHCDENLVLGLEPIPRGEGGR